MRRALPLFVAIVITSLPLAAQSVRVVDACGGAGTLPTIQDAIDAVTDGDPILVRPGVCPGFVVDDRALTIVGDGSGVDLVERLSLSGPAAAVEILELASKRALDMAGLDIELSSPDDKGDTALLVSACAGRVPIADCEGVTTGFEAFGIQIEDSQAASLVDVPVDAPQTRMTFDGDAGSHALDCRDSTVFTYDCEGHRTCRTTSRSSELSWTPSRTARSPAPPARA